MYAGANKVAPTVLANAYHEAGHAVAAVLLGLPVYGATIMRGKAHDVRHQNPLLRGMLDELHNVTAHTKDLMERLAIVALAGPRAQRQHDARSYWRYHGAADYNTADGLAMRVAQDSVGARLLLKYWQWNADGLVRVRWPEIASVGAALLVRGTLMPTDIRHAIRSAS